MSYDYATELAFIAGFGKAAMKIANTHVSTRIPEPATK